MQTSEQGLIEHATLEQLQQLAHHVLRGGLIESRPAKPNILELVKVHVPNAQEVMYARQVSVARRTISAGDVALVNVGGALVVAEVWFHITIDGGCARSCVSYQDNISGDMYTRTAERIENPMLICCTDVRASCIYRELANNRIMVIVPSESW